MATFASKLSVAAALTAWALAINTTRAAEALTIGSKAPPLNVEHWVQNGNGKFKPVTKFEPGKVYVVEFWATWCGPCVASMPHLAEMQAEYSDKGVQIVSISDEDLETVEKFLERPVRGQQAEDQGEPRTYRDLTSAYCLTTDPDQSSSEDYMLAAGQNGIPTSFVVGKDSKIEWIGHPMELDETLKAVVAGTWDREAFAADFKAKQELERAMQEVGSLVRKGDFDAALELIDELGKKDTSLEFKLFKLQVLVAAKKPAAVTELTLSLYKEMADDAGTINMLAWNLYDYSAEGEIKLDSLIDASIAACEAALSKADKEVKPSLLDTVAHYYFAKGDFDKAIELETQALKLTGPGDRQFMENFLQELQDAKAKPPASKEDK